MGINAGPVSLLWLLQFLGNQISESSVFMFEVCSPSSSYEIRKDFFQKISKHASNGSERHLDSLSALYVRLYWYSEHGMCIMAYHVRIDCRWPSFGRVLCLKVISAWIFMLNVFWATAEIDVVCFLTATLVWVFWMCNEEVIFVRLSDCRSFSQATQRIHVKFDMRRMKPKFWLRIQFLLPLDCYSVSRTTVLSSLS